MKYFSDMASAHLLSDLYFEGEEQAGGPFLEGSIRLRSINDQAYFVLLFSQLEAEVNRLCAELIRHKQAQSDWWDRRAWDILDPREKPLRAISLMNRVALLTAKGGRVYNRVKELYEARSMIAHGELLAAPLDLAKIAKEMQDIASQLQERP